MAEITAGTGLSVDGKPYTSPGPILPEHLVSAVRIQVAKEIAAAIEKAREESDPLDIHGPDHFAAYDDAAAVARSFTETAEDRRIVRIGGVPVGVAIARTILEDGTIVYEVEPSPVWRFPAHEREVIEP